MVTARPVPLHQRRRRHAGVASRALPQHLRPADRDSITRTKNKNKNKNKNKEQEQEQEQKQEQEKDPRKNKKKNNFYYRTTTRTTAAVAAAAAAAAPTHWPRPFPACTPTPPARLASVTRIAQPLLLKIMTTFIIASMNRHITTTSSSSSSTKTTTAHNHDDINNCHMIRHSPASNCAAQIACAHLRGPLQSKSRPQSVIVKNALAITIANQNQNQSDNRDII